MADDFKKLIKSTLIGAVSSIISTNAMGIDTYYEGVESKDETTSNDNLENPLKFNWTPKLMLSRNELGDWEYNSHRSHRSHSSHRSHYSSSSGSGSTRPYTPPSSYTPPSTYNPSNSLNGTKKSTLSYIRVKFKNSCSEKIKVLVQFKDASSDEWVTKAWYLISPYETVYVLNTKNSILYFYAESESYYWGGDDSQVVEGGKSYDLKKLTITASSDGDFIKEITCN
ncbi:hypothetical protein EC396_13325 [Lutibacter sp. HS1-25]|uniref:hypothetical protein n=1 Tax=Lutibacter sp. HS1-25 TaxID=2485000 RepID=UPI0010121136|nr:hypothetical protein [Lutibacter sp. HS1-25]RXP46856.1 hypothetical protein EC396_13325 [Lutibacter sp. HS1-25]